jgi:hypothetical protein
MTDQSPLEIVFAAMPIVVAGYVVWAIRHGRIRSRSFTYERRKNPIGFWVTVAIYMVLALALSLPLWMAYFLD